MSRTTKLLVTLALAAAALVTTIVILLMIYIPKASYGADSPQAQTAPLGWIQLALAALSTVGFSGTALWQIASSFIEKRLESSGVSKDTTKSAIDFAKVTGILAIVKTLPPGPTRISLSIAGRDACDELKDSLFPNFPATT